MSRQQLYSSRITLRPQCGHTTEEIQRPKQAEQEGCKDSGTSETTHIKQQQQQLQLLLLLLCCCCCSAACPATTTRQSENFKTAIFTIVRYVAFRSLCTYRHHYKCSKIKPPPSPLISLPSPTTLSPPPSTTPTTTAVAATTKNSTYILQM